eukprot:symbB.v1.2.030162.t1/scaffold3356.1/size58521/3
MAPKRACAFALINARPCQKGLAHCGKAASAQLIVALLALSCAYSAAFSAGATSFGSVARSCTPSGTALEAEAEAAVTKSG